MVVYKVVVADAQLRTTDWPDLGIRRIDDPVGTVTIRSGRSQLRARWFRLAASETAITRPHSAGGRGHR
jgi:hypothetical protein